MPKSGRTVVHIECKESVSTSSGSWVSGMQIHIISTCYHCAKYSILPCLIKPFSIPKKSTQIVKSCDTCMNVKLDQCKTQPYKIMHDDIWIISVSADNCLFRNIAIDRYGRYLQIFHTDICWYLYLLYAGKGQSDDGCAATIGQHWLCYFKMHSIQLILFLFLLVLKIWKLYRGV